MQHEIAFTKKPKKNRKKNAKINGNRSKTDMYEIDLMAEHTINIDSAA